MCHQDEDEHHVGELERSTWVRVHHGGEADQQHDARQEFGRHKEDELHFANIDQRQDGDGDEDGQRVPIGAQTLEEGVELDTSTPLTKRPHHRGHQKDVREGDRGEDVDSRKTKVQMMLGLLDGAAARRSHRQAGVGAGHRQDRGHRIVVGEDVVADRDGIDQRKRDPYRAKQIWVRLNVSIDVST